MRKCRRKGTNSNLPSLGLELKEALLDQTVDLQIEPRHPTEEEVRELGLSVGVQLIWDA